MPTTRYATSCDVQLAYQVIGDGPFDLVFSAGSFTHLDVDWEEPLYRRFCERIATRCRLILYDKRGMGLSDRVQAGALGERMDDIRAVMDAVGSERAALLGNSEGGPLSILFADAYPERTIALILCGAEVKEETTADWPWGESARPEFEAAMATVPDRWGSGSAVGYFAPSLAHDEEYRHWLGRLLTNSATPNAAVTFMRMAFEIDVRHVLASICVPTFVVHRTGDRVCDVHNGRYVAEHVPGAEYMEVPGVDHFPWVAGEDVLDAILGYIDDRIVPSLAASAVVDRDLVVEVALPDGPKLPPAPAETRLVQGSIAGPGSRAAALFAEGVVAAANGETETARVLLDRAAGLAHESGDRRLEARARFELGRALSAAGDASGADAEARTAIGLMLREGDRTGAERVAALLRTLDVPRSSRRTTASMALTRRELDVLRLVAQGRSNDEIAGDLVLSPHTVHRHMGNILTRMGVPSRAAAVAEAARSGFL